MADNLGVSTGTDATVRTKDNAGVHLNVSAISDTTGANIASVSAGGLLSVDASGAAVPVTDNGSTLSVDDGAGSLTIDNAALSVVGGGVQATALRVTIASDSTGLVSVDDNGGTLSVDDGAGSLTVDNAALSVTGGGVEASALRVTIASDSTGVLSVDDNGSSLTIDNAALSVTGGGVEASALRVTIASDSTGVLSIDDNGSTLTVDQATASNLNAQVVGAVAHDTGASGNPVSVAGTAETPADSDNANLVSADGDIVRLLASRDGAQFVLPHGPRIWSASNRYTATQTDAAVKAAPSAGLSLYITDIYFASEAQMRVALEESSTVYVWGYTSAGGGDGVSKHWQTPLKLAAAKGLTVVTTGTSATCDLVVSGYTAP